MEISKKILIPVVLGLIGLFIYQYYDYPVAVQVTRGIDQTYDHQEQTDLELVARRDVRSFIDQEIRQLNPAKIEVCPLDRDSPFMGLTTYNEQSRDTCLTDYRRAGYDRIVEAARAAQPEEP